MFASYLAASVAILASNMLSANEIDPHFYEAGDWHVEYKSLTCYLVNEQAGSDATLKIMQTRLLGPELVIMFEPKIIGLTDDTKVTFQIDSHSSAGVMQYNGSNFSSMNPDVPFYEDVNKPLMRAFQSGKQMQLIADDQSLATFSLVGSAAAYRALQSCVDQIYDGPIRPEKIAPPKPLQSAWKTGPALTGPFPANREARPIKLESWISIDDYMADGPIDAGVVRVRLAVSAAGRATTCKIVESSGVPRLDERTCKLLVRRAMFEPATNALGQLIASEWSNKVRWQFSE
jgi:TonB family protein